MTDKDLGELEADDHWYQDMVRCGWQMPVVPRWKTLPIIRHVRAFIGLWRVNRHREAMRATGLGMLDTGYDSWVLYGIWHGREGKR